MSDPFRAKILLAESNLPLRSLLIEILEARGHAVRTAEDGILARDLFELAPEDFDLVVIRSRLPQMNGLELFRVVRTMAPGKPVLFMKESADEEIVGLAPCCEVISKPFSKHQFITAVQRCLS
ncbi:MAG: response regulator [Bdellovibrionota bacterium]